MACSITSCLITISSLIGASGSASCSVSVSGWESLNSIGDVSAGSGMSATENFYHINKKR